MSVYTNMFRFFRKRRHEAPKPELPGPEFYFCETRFASWKTPWHIRKLTDAGPKYGGGADTSALCGRAVAWDRHGGLTAHQLKHCCQKCAEIYKKQLIAELTIQANGDKL